MATQGEAAAHIFVTDRIFVQYLDKGIVKRADRGSYDLDRVRKEYIEYIRERAAGREQKGPLDPSQELARRNKEMADKYAMANAVSRGELLHVDAVRKFIIDAFTRVRTKMLGIPNKLTIRLVGLRAETEIYGLLDGSIREALTELSEQDTVDAAVKESASEEEAA